MTPGELRATSCGIIRVPSSAPRRWERNGTAHRRASAAQREEGMEKARSAPTCFGSAKGGRDGEGTQRTDVLRQRKGRKEWRTHAAHRRASAAQREEGMENPC